MKRSAPDRAEHKLSTPSKRKRVHQEVEQICTICQESVSVSDTPIKTLPCGHAFHLNCAEQWLKRKAVCPNCRFKIPRSMAPRSPIELSSDSETSSESNHVLPNFNRRRRVVYSIDLKVEETGEDSDSGSESESESESEVDGDTVLPIGQYAWKSYAVIVAEDPSYCDWVLSLDRAYGALKGFQDYLLELRGSGQLRENSPRRGGRSGQRAENHPRGGGRGRPRSAAVEAGEEEEVGFGRHGELTFAELAAQHPGYCSWILRLPDTVGRMRKLQSYLKRKRRTEQHA